MSAWLAGLRTTVEGMDRKKRGEQVEALQEELQTARSMIAALRRDLDNAAIDVEVLKYLTKINCDLDKKCEASLRMIVQAFPEMRRLSGENKVAHKPGVEEARRFMDEWEKSKHMFVQIPDELGAFAGGK